MRSVPERERTTKNLWLVLYYLSGNAHSVWMDARCIPESLQRLADGFDALPKGGDWSSMAAAEKAFMQVHAPFQGSPMIPDAVKYWDRIGELADLPPDQFAEQELKVRQASGQYMPHAPKTERAKCILVEIEIHRVMLQAALAVQLRGKETLSEFRDPYSHNPFEYKKLKSGFQLTSDTKIEAKPVTLIIGEQ